MNLSEQEMTTLLGLIGLASHEQLRKVSEHLRSVHDLRHRQATDSVQVGAKVKWNGKHGPKTGVVLRVKQKYVEVRDDAKNPIGLGMTWNVPAAMLTVIP